MAIAFALTLGVAFAEEQTPTPAAEEKAPAAEKIPAKYKKHAKKKHKKAKKRSSSRNFGAGYEVVYPILLIHTIERMQLSIRYKKDPPVNPAGLLLMRTSPECCYSPCVILYA